MNTCNCVWKYGIIEFPNTLGFINHNDLWTIGMIEHFVGGTISNGAVAPLEFGLNGLFIRAFGYVFNHTPAAICGQYQL